MRDVWIRLDGGGMLRAYDIRQDAGDGLAVFWQHGTPNTGEPPEPLFAAAGRLGIRWVSYDRPGYGGSTPRPGRTIGSAADDVARIADVLGLGRFAVMGHSGGGSHALGCAARLRERVVAVVSIAGLAPFRAENLDWFAGMAASGVASLRAAAAGRPTKERYEASGADYDPEFTPADWAALRGEWSWLGRVASAGMRAGPGGLIDDDLAYVNPWGCDPDQIVAPTLLLHGGTDRVVPRAHSQWLAGHCAGSELRVFPDDGHISVLRAAPAALEWLRSHAGSRPTSA